MSWLKLIVRGITSIAEFLYSVWKELPNSTKEKIIEVIVTEFKKLFIKFYQDFTKGKND